MKGRLTAIMFLPCPLISCRNKGEQMLVAKNLSVTLKDGDREFRLGIDALTVAKGEAVGLTGSSGSGKTLLLELLGLLREPDQGGDYSVTEGPTGQHDLRTCWSGKGAGSLRATMRGEVFGFVPQTGGLIPFLSLRQNIEITQKVSGRLDANWIDTLCTRLGLCDVQHMSPENYPSVNANAPPSPAPLPTARRF